MRELLIAGILYLTGVGVLLLMKPQLIFTERGAWKEFGIGRNPESYTWMPFWLFCIFWALISYSLVFVIIRKIDGTTGPQKAPEISLLEKTPARTAPKIVRTTGLRRAPRAPAYAYYGVNDSPVMRRNNNNGLTRYIYYGEPRYGEPEFIKY